jgi:hypothetical protein
MFPSPIARGSEVMWLAQSATSRTMIPFISSEFNR